MINRDHILDAVPPKTMKYKFKKYTNIGESEILAT